MNCSNISYRQNPYRRNTFSMGPGMRKSVDKEQENLRTDNEIKKPRKPYLDKENVSYTGNKQPGYISINAGFQSSNTNYISVKRTTEQQENLRNKTVTSKKKQLTEVSMNERNNTPTYNILNENNAIFSSYDNHLEKPTRSWRGMNHQMYDRTLRNNSNDEFKKSQRILLTHESVSRGKSETKKEKSQNNLSREYFKKDLLSSQKVRKTIHSRERILNRISNSSLKSHNRNRESSLSQSISRQRESSMKNRVKKKLAETLHSEFDDQKYLNVKHEKTPLTSKARYHERLTFKPSSRSLDKTPVLFGCEGSTNKKKEQMVGLEEDVTALRDKLDKYNKKKADKQNEFKKQNEELLKDNMRLRMERNLGQHSNNQKSQKNLVEDNQILSQQIIDLKNELEYWKKNQTNNKSKRDHSNDENVHYKHEYEKLKERNRKLSKEMSHLQTQFKEKLEFVAKKADKFETDKNELLSNLDIFNNKVENLEYELDKAAEDKKNLQYELDKAAEVKKNLEYESDKALEEQKNLEYELDKAAENKKNLEYESDYYKKKYDTIYLDNLDIKKEITRVKDQNSELIENEKSFNNKLEHDQDIFENKMSQLICDYENELLKFQDELEFTKNEKLEGAKTIDMLINVKKDMEEEFDVLKNDFMNLINDNNQISYGTEKYETLGAKNFETNAKEELQKEIDHLKTELEQNSTDFAKKEGELGTKLTSYLEEIDSLNKQVEGLNETVSESQTRYKLTQEEIQFEIKNIQEKYESEMKNSQAIKEAIQNVEKEKIDALNELEKVKQSSYESNTIKNRLHQELSNYMKESKEIDTPKISKSQEYSPNNSKYYGTLNTMKNTLLEDQILELPEDKLETPIRQSTFKKSEPEFNSHLDENLDSNDLSLLKSVNADYDKVLNQLEDLLIINKELMQENGELLIAMKELKTKLEEFSKVKDDDQSKDSF